MKHILNNLSEEEKNSIREQHTGGMKVMTESFSRLLNAKLGDAKPLVKEQSYYDNDLETSGASINTTTNVPLFGNVKNYHREKRLSPSNWGKKINNTIEALNLDELNEKLKKSVKNQQFNSGFPNLNVYLVSIKDKGNNNGVDLSYSFSYSDPKTDGYNFISIVFNPKGQSQESKNNALSKNPGSKVVNTGTFNFQNKEYEYHLIGIPLKFQ